MKRICKNLRDALLENPRVQDLAPELTKHLDGCSSCAEWLQDLQRMETIWEIADKNLPTEQELNIASQNAIRRIRLEHEESTLKSWFRERFSWKIAWGVGLAVVVFVTGIYLGNMMRRVPPEMFQTARQAIPTWIINALQSESADLPTDTQMAGWGLSQILAYMIKYDQNAGHRLNSVEELSNIDDDKLALDALIYALRNDTNPGIRMKSIKSLRKRPMSRTLRDAYIYSLFNDENPGIRLEAIEGLTPAVQDRQVMETLRFIAASDRHEGVRTQAREVIRSAEIG